jgi:crotonobetainyl-CoA:carnitine CoA-transferase CaiB-like acyl-CoA transferase
LGERTAAEAVETLQKHHVAAGPVRDLAEALADEHLRERGAVVPLEHPTAGAIPGGRAAGIRSSSGITPPASRAPRLRSAPTTRRSTAGSASARRISARYAMPA